MTKQAVNKALQEKIVELMKKFPGVVSPEISKYLLSSMNELAQWVVTTMESSDTK